MHVSSKCGYARFDTVELLVTDSSDADQIDCDNDFDALAVMLCETHKFACETAPQLKKKPRAAHLREHIYCTVFLAMATATPVWLHDVMTKAEAEGAFDPHRTVVNRFALRSRPFVRHCGVWITSVNKLIAWFVSAVRYLACLPGLR